MKTVRTLKEATQIISESGLDLSTMTSVQDFASQVVMKLSTDPVKMASLLSLVKVVQRHFDPKTPKTSNPLGKTLSRVVVILKKENMTFDNFKNMINNLPVETIERIEKVAKKPVRSKKLPTPPASDTSMQP